MNMRRNVLLVLFAMILTACGSEDVPPGNKGFMFDRSGALALYTGGDGLDATTILGPGTYYTGIYDEIRDINCRDAHAKEAVHVLTKSDITVLVDVRITYAARCDSKKAMIRILDEVTSKDGAAIEPATLYDLYILPIVRESLRNRLADVTIEDVKKTRVTLRDGILEDLAKSIGDRDQPVKIQILTVSDIQLPKEIVDKNRQIELARQEAEQEREKQEASKFRLARELFEAQKEREVQKENAQKLKDVALIDAQRDKEVRILKAEAERDSKIREADGIKALRSQLSRDYVNYLHVIKDAEVRKQMAAAMNTGTKWYVGPDFLIPPGGSANVSVSK